MTRLVSNRLGDLAERIRQAQVRARAASVEAAAQSIEAGRLLCEAKAECKHGDWLPFLSVAEVPERQAQRLMQLARSGLKPDTVSDLGGVKAALRFLAWLDAHPPEPKFSAEECATAIIKGRIARDAEATCPGIIQEVLDLLVEQNPDDIRGRLDRILKVAAEADDLKRECGRASSEARRRFIQWLEQQDEPA